MASQLISGYFAQFTKTGNPNPSLEYLKIRGYTNVSKIALRIPVRIANADCSADNDGSEREWAVGRSQWQDWADEGIGLPSVDSRVPGPATV